MFVKFPVFPLPLIFSFISVIRKYSWYDFSVLMFVKTFLWLIFSTLSCEQKKRESKKAAVSKKNSNQKYYFQK